MILWIIKQLLSLRQAVLGRAHPSELAWGLAIGVGIGLIPKGNLVSVLLISSLVTLRVNHGVAALAAVVCSFLAARFDPWTHELGVMVLGAEQVRPFMERIWNWPLMPWTDLNNTVVMGSTVLAGAALLPTYAVSLPLFQWLAARTALHEGRLEPVPLPEPNTGSTGARNARPAPGSTQSSIPAATPVLAGDSMPTAEVETEAELRVAALTEAVVEAEVVAEANAEREPAIVVETQIDVIRLKPASDDGASSTGGSEPVSGGQMNEALGYLLRRLRDSRQGKAA